MVVAYDMKIDYENYADTCHAALVRVGMGARGMVVPACFFDATGARNYSMR